MFKDEPISSLENNPVLGIYLGPSIDVGPVLTDNILKSNGEVFHRSTHHNIMTYELQSE